MSRKDKKLVAQEPSAEKPLPRLAKILGVRVDQHFRIEGYPEYEYKVSKAGNLLYRHPDSEEGWAISYRMEVAAINHPEMITREDEEHESENADAGDQK